MARRSDAQSIEIFHLLFLRVLAKGQANWFTLKDGANLRYFFGSPRYSNDIDLDFVGRSGGLASHQNCRLAAVWPSVGDARAGFQHRVGRGVCGQADGDDTPVEDRAFRGTATRPGPNEDRILGQRRWERRRGLRRGAQRDRSAIRTASHSRASQPRSHRFSMLRWPTCTPSRFGTQCAWLWRTI